MMSKVKAEEPVPEEKGGVLKECKTFMETSSVKGVSRVIKSQTPCLKVTWLVVTVCCVTISLFTCTFICQEYLAYPSKIKVMEYNGWNKDEWKIVTEKYDNMLLSLTLCNHKSLSSTPRNLSEGVLSFIEFQTRLNQMYADVLNSPKLIALYGKIVIDMIWQTLYGSGYVQTVPLTELEKLGHSMEDFMVACYFEVSTASSVKSIPCGDAAEFYSILTSKHFFCHVIAPTMKIYSYGIPTSVSVILYLDNFSNQVPLTFDVTSETGQEAGVRMVPHRQNMLPRIVLDGISVAPGQHVTFNTKFVGKDRLHAPYTKCQHEEEVQLFDIRNASVKYQKEHCYLGCMEKKSVQKCDCRTMASQVILGPWPKNVSDILPCGHVFWENITNTLEKLICMQSVFSDQKQKECSGLCQQPCTQLLVEKLSLSHTKWPVSNALPAFYLDHIKDQSYGYRFRAYGDIISQWQQQNISQDEMLHKMKQLSLIEDNFVKISIEANSLDVMSYETVPSMTVSSMLSSVGGALNLYAGLTIIFIFEIIEFFFKLVWTHRFGFKRNNLTKVNPM